jgi:hypothetical protein
MRASQDRSSLLLSPCPASKRRKRHLTVRPLLGLQPSTASAALDSPLGYMDALAADYSSLTSSYVILTSQLRVITD